MAGAVLLSESEAENDLVYVTRKMVKGSSRLPRHLVVESFCALATYYLIILISSRVLSPRQRTLRSRDSQLRQLLAALQVRVTTTIAALMTERIGYIRENLAPQGQSLSGRDVELFLFLFSLKIHLDKTTSYALFPTDSQYPWASSSYLWIRPSLIPTLSALSATLLIPLYLLHYILARIKNLTSSRRVTPPLAAYFVCVPCMAPSVRRLEICYHSLTRSQVAQDGPNLRKQFRGIPYVIYRPSYPVIYQPYPNSCSRHHAQHTEFVIWLKASGMYVSVHPPSPWLVESIPFWRLGEASCTEG